MVSSIFTPQKSRYFSSILTKFNLGKSSRFWGLNAFYVIIASEGNRTYSFITMEKQEMKIHRLFYFHVNGSIGIVQNIDFEIRPDLGCTTFKTSGKVVLDNPSVCLTVCLAVDFPASSHRHKV